MDRIAFGMPANHTDQGELSSNQTNRETRPATAPCLQAILGLASAGSGIDFGGFRSAPLARVATQQMHFAGFQDPAKYLAWLRAHPEKARDLARELLNRTTHFFRNPEVYDQLKDRVLRPLVESRRHDGPIRIWVAGCATGEEAYSIGILLLECLGDADLVPPCRIFATDISPVVLRTARAGIYTARALQGISRERLERFFRRSNGHYQVVEPLRNMCVFSRRDVATQRPFSNLDLISCRNVMLYMTPDVRKKILERFYRALRPGAFLLLGRSESPNFNSRLFKKLNRHGIYRKNDTDGRR